MLVGYLRRHGADDVAVLEAPTVYGHCFENRSVEQVAAYFGFDVGRVSDRRHQPRPAPLPVRTGLRPARHQRDLARRRPAHRPAEAAHGPDRVRPSQPLDARGQHRRHRRDVYAGRSTDFRSATMMLLDVAPPDFAVVDAWAPVADGPFGVMGCRRPAQVRHVYAGADALAVDEVVLADLGIYDPTPGPDRSPRPSLVRAPALAPDRRRGASASARRASRGAPLRRACGPSARSRTRSTCT